MQTGYKFKNLNLLWRTLTHDTFYKIPPKDFSIYREFDIAGEKLLQYVLCD